MEFSAHSPSFSTQFIPLSCCSPLAPSVNLSVLQSPLLLLSKTLCLLRLIFASPLLEATEFTVGAGQPENTNGEGVGVVAAKRDGYNNPCSGSTHVLNYCHKCSSTRPLLNHHSHSAISSTDALSSFCYIIASLTNKSSPT